jgi:hypothetical protein
MPASSDILARLWSAARIMFARMRAAVGDAGLIAARHVLSMRERRAIREWLAPVVAMVRKIVLIEAIALTRTGFAQAPVAARRAADIAGRASHTTSLRLWPRQSASSGPRVRDLSPALLVRDVWRESRRLALARRLDRVRFMRAPPQERLARCIAALARILDNPLAAVRRLARKLRALPRLVVKLAAKAPPRSKRYTEPEIALANIHAFADARGFEPDSS